MTLFYDEETKYLKKEVLLLKKQGTITAYEENNEGKRKVGWQVIDFAEYTESGHFTLEI